MSHTRQMTEMNSSKVSSDSSSSTPAAESAVSPAVIEAAAAMSTIRTLDGSSLLSLDLEARSALLLEGPAVLLHMIDDWPALTTDKATWTDKERFMRRFGSHRLEDPVPCQSRDGDAGPTGPGEFDCPLRKIPLRELAELRGFLIVPDRKWTLDDQTLIRDLFEGHEPPEILQSVKYIGSSVGVTAGDGVGHSRHSASWLALVAGAKLWFLAPPDLPQPEQPVCGNLEVAAANSRRDGVVHALQLPGQVVFFPTGWWHATCNLSPFTNAIGGFMAEGPTFYTTAERVARGIPTHSLEHPHWTHALYIMNPPLTKKEAANDPEQ